MIASDAVWCRPPGRGIVLNLTPSGADSPLAPDRGDEGGGGRPLDEMRERERAAETHVVVHSEDDVSAGTRRTRPLQPSSSSGAQAELLRF